MYKISTSYVYMYSTSVSEVCQQVGLAAALELSLHFLTFRSKHWLEEEEDGLALYKCSVDDRSIEPC